MCRRVGMWACGHVGVHVKGPCGKTNLSLSLSGARSLKVNRLAFTTRAMKKAVYCAWRVYVDA